MTIFEQRAKTTTMIAFYWWVVASLLGLCTVRVQYEAADSNIRRIFSRLAAGFSTFVIGR